jgi:hypothetical protein
MYLQNERGDNQVYADLVIAEYLVLAVKRPLVYYA